MWHSEEARTAACDCFCLKQQINDLLIFLHKLWRETERADERKRHTHYKKIEEARRKKILSWVQCNTQKFVLILTLAVLYQQQPKLPSEKLLLSYLLDILWVCANVRVCAWSVDVQEGERVGKGGFFAQFL